MSLPTSVGLPTPRRHNSSSVIQQTSLWGPVVYTSNDRDILRYSSARASQQAQHVPSLHDRSSDQVSSQRLTSTRSSKAIGPLPYYAVPRPQKSNTSQHHHHHHHHNSSSAHRNVGAGGGGSTSETSRLVNGTSPRSSKAMHAVPLMTSAHGTDPAQLRRHSMMSLSLTPTTLSSTGSANGKEARVNYVQTQGNAQVQSRPNVRSSPAAAVPLRINENNNSNNTISGNTAGTTNDVSRGQNITVLSVYSPVASDDPRLRPHYQKVPQSRSPLPASMPLPHGTPTRSDARASAPPSRLPTAVRETLPSLRPPLATTTRPRYGSAPSARPTNVTNTTTTPVCSTPMSSAGGDTNRVRRPARQECKATQTEDRSYLTALPSQPPRSSQSMDQPHKEGSTPLYVNHTSNVPSSNIGERGVDVASQTNPQDIQQPARSSKAGPAQPLVPYAQNGAVQPQARIAAAQPLAVSTTTPANLPPRPTPPGTQVRIHTNTLTTTQHKVRYVRLEDEFDPDAPDPSDMGVVEAARYAQRIQQQEEEEQDNVNGGQVGVPRGAYMSDGHAWVRRSDRGPVASTRHPLRITDTSEEGEERGVQPTPGPAYVMVPNAQSHPHRDINGSEVNIMQDNSEAGLNANIESTTTPYGIYNKAGGYLLQRHVQQAVTGPLAAGTSFAPPPQPRLLQGAPPPQLQIQQQPYEEGVNEAGKAMRRVPLSATSQPAKVYPSSLYVNNEAMTPNALRGNASAPARHRFEGYNHYTFTETPQPPSTPQLQNHIVQQQQQNSSNAIHSGPRVVVASPSYRNAGQASGQSPYYKDTQYDEERPYEAYAAHRRIHTRDTPGNEYDEYNADEDEDEEDVLSEPRTPERCSRQATGSEVTYKPLSEQRTESAQAVRWNGQRTTTGGSTHTTHERHHGGGMTTANIRHGVRSTRNREERHTGSTGGGGSSSEHNYYNSSNNGGGGNNGRSSSCDTNTQPAMLSERDSKDAASEAEEDDVALAKPRPQHLIIDEEVYTLPIDQAHPEATLRLSRSDFEQGRMAMYTSVNHDPSHDTNEVVVQEESAQREEEEEDSGDDDAEEESAGVYEPSPT